MSGLEMLEIRNRLGLSQLEFSNILGVSRKTVSLYENSDQIPLHTAEFIKSHVTKMSNNDTSNISVNALAKPSKSASFFKEKALFYISEIEELIKRIDDFRINNQEKISKFLSDTGFSYLFGYDYEIGGDVDLLIFKIKLLVSEFDNGNLFIQKFMSEKAEESDLYYSKNKLIVTKKALVLFIQHLEDFRL